MGKSTDGIPANSNELSLGGLDRMIGFRLRRVQIVMTRRLAKVSDKHNLTPGSFPFLALIVANPGASQSDLAQCVGVDKSAAVAIFDSLEKNGLAIRERSARDRRRHQIVPTEKGRALLEEMLAQAYDDERALVRPLTPATVASIKASLDQLYQLVLGAEQAEA